MMVLNNWFFSSSSILTWFPQTSNCFFHNHFLCYVLIQSFFKVLLRISLSFKHLFYKPVNKVSSKLFISNMFFHFEVIKWDFHYVTNYSYWFVSKQYFLMWVVYCVFVYSFKICIYTPWWICSHTRITKMLSFSVFIYDSLQSSKNFFYGVFKLCLAHICN